VTGHLSPNGRRTAHLNLCAGFGKRVPGHVGQLSLKRETCRPCGVEFHGLLVSLDDNVNVGFKNPLRRMAFEGPTDSCTLGPEGR